QRVDHRRADDDRGAVLVIVEHRDLQPLAQLALDDEALGRLDVLQVDAAEGGLEAGDDLDQFVRVLLVDLDVEHVDAGELLEQHALAFHDRLAGQRADVAQAQHRGAVGDHRDQVAARGVVAGLVRIGGNLLAGVGHARRVRQRQVALGEHRLGGVHLDLAARLQAVVIQGGLAEMLSAFGAVGGFVGHGRWAGCGNSILAVRPRQLLHDSRTRRAGSGRMRACGACGAARGGVRAGCDTATSPARTCRAPAKRPRVGASTGIRWGERSEPQRNPRAPRALNVRVHPPGAVAWRARALGFALLTPTYGAGSPFEIRSRRMRLANSENASRPARPLARATQSGSQRGGASAQDSNSGSKRATSSRVILPANSCRHWRSRPSRRAWRKKVCTSTRPRRYTVSLANAAPPSTGTPRNTRWADEKLSAGFWPASRNQPNTCRKSAPSSAIAIASVRRLTRFMRSMSMLPGICSASTASPSWVAVTRGEDIARLGSVSWARPLSAVSECTSASWCSSCWRS